MIQYVNHELQSLAIDRIEWIDENGISTKMVYRQKYW